MGGLWVPLLLLLAGVSATAALGVLPKASLTALSLDTKDNISIQGSPAPNATLNATNDVVVQQSCPGVPSQSPYVAWACPTGTPDGGSCSGACTPGAKAPYGPPVASCTAGAYTIGRTCMAGGIYNFDDVTVDGSPPTRFLGLIWRGLRVTNSQRYTNCEGHSGFRYGVVSGPNVAYSLEVGASGDLTNLVRITAPTPQAKMSLAGFVATAAWQDGLRMDVTAYDSASQPLGMQSFTLSFFQPTVIDMRSDLRFSGINRVTIVTSGGLQVSCATGKQVVIDNIEIYLHGD